jgi:integrase
MKAKLTDKFLTALAEKGQPHPPVWDKQVSGFGVRIGKHGGITYFAMRRLRGGGSRPIRVKIGSYPLLKLADAREEARAILRDLQGGIDPRVREAEKAKAEAAKQQSLYREIGEQFIRHIGRARTAKAIEHLVRRELISRWGDRPIGDIRRGDIVSMIDEITNRGHLGAAHNAFAYARRLHRWAIGRGVIEHSPFDRLRPVDLIGRLKPRQRLLAPAELRLIWLATEGAPEAIYPDGLFIRLLLLLGTRRTELSDARWPEFDLAAARWVIPAERMKNNEAHVIPLPDAAVAILKAMPRFNGVDYVFTRRGGRPLTGLGAAKKELDERIAKLNGKVSLPHWTYHDTRRAFRTGLSMLGIAQPVAEMCIGHKQAGLVRVYDLHRFESEKRQAFERWATWLLSTVEPPRSADVIPLLRQAS